MGATRAIRLGMPVEELETPVLTVEIEAMQRNLARMMGILAGSTVRLRPHLKTAKSPALAHLMVQAGAVGVCAAKLSEAEALANAGITDILLTSEVAGFGKVERLVALASRLAAFKAVVDNAPAVGEIARLARERGVTVKLLIELDVNTGRSGVSTPNGVLNLANTIRETDGVELLGLHGYAGHAQIRPPDDRRERNDKAMKILSETVELLREHNHDVRIVSGGGTGTCALDVANGFLNEVQAGSFLLMDTAYRNTDVPFENAVRCLTTIISRPTAERAVCDAGQKTMSHDAGPPEVENRPGVRYLRGSDEHGLIAVEPAEQDRELNVGDVISLLPSHICTTINLHDVLVGVRDGVVEAIYPIEARGHVW
ncbi:MAG: DSD1 family PLP-dependent enzyme [Planctomycetaceae bacterium]